ncbi:Panacea domain-containing protein [Pedobacter sp. SYP-B3415]|uniref:Panacea domain-containing protein n=1 Tax=Pedobacter sp. SYP-B3415 TaxID=2496641 RepID=UPI0013EBB07A|nr:type II toxin-antitoxin system antitoxin SocA domain-containing protein [Pedobacter sp. SYP-B3415]
MKLQKMVYFAHGYTLAVHDTPLIFEAVQAWKFGPVIPAIYNEYKYYGSDPIINTDWVDEDESCSGAPGQESPLAAPAREAIDYTWQATSHRSATQLSSWSHKEGSPWQQVYNEYDNGIEIPNELIKTYFKSFLF